MADFTRERESTHDHELVLEEDLLLEDEPVASVGRARRSELRELRGVERALERRTVRVGELLAGKYRVERVHPSGAHGLTVDAEHLQLGQRVSVKMSVADGGSQTDGAARFLRGARFAAQLRNPHVARVVDLGTLDSGAAFVVTEHLTGSDLRGVLRVREWLPASEAVDYVLQACEALAEAHVAGFMHRNLKPSNLFLARDDDGRPSLKVLDFCIAEGPLSDVAVTSLSRSSVSSLAYLAPEQVRDPLSADARVDIWALGAVLHELLTGVAAFAAASAPGLFATIAADAPVPTSQLRSDIPAELEAIVLRCLEKERDYRYPGVGELARQLRPFASEAGQDSVDWVIKTLERRTRNPRSLQPPAPHGLLGAPSNRVPPATVIPAQNNRVRRAVEVGVVALGVLGCSMGIGAYVTIRNLQSILAARPAEAVVASLSPALTASTPVTSAVAAPPIPVAPPAPSPVVPVVSPTAQRVRIAAVQPVKPVSRARDSSQPDVMAQPKAATIAAPKRGLFDDAN